MLALQRGEAHFAGVHLLDAESGRFNIDFVQRLLDENPDANAKLLLPNNNIQALMRSCNHGFQVLPGSGDLDGFYFACLDKNA